MKKNRIMAGVMAAAIVFGAAPNVNGDFTVIKTLSVGAAEENGITCTIEGITYALDSDGTLTISGEGEGIYGPANLEEFEGRLDEIKKVIFNGTFGSLWNYAFESCHFLEEISLPEGLEAVWEGAFSDCPNLKSVSVPESLNFCDKLAFSGTPWFERMRNENAGGFVIINNILVDGTGCEGFAAIPDDVVKIADRAFLQNTDITGIIIPDNVKEIGQLAFFGCEKLLDVILPENPEKIGRSAFENTPWIEKAREESSDGLVTAGELIIDGKKCSGNINIPEGITYVPDGAFYGCSTLEAVTFPKSLKTIGKYSFTGCENLQKIIIPDNVTYIGDGAFQNCSSLVYAQLPDGVTGIKTSEFAMCGNLKAVVIPDSVEADRIESFAFYGSENLTFYTDKEEIKQYAEYRGITCDSAKTDFTGVSLKPEDSFDLLIGIKMTCGEFETMLDGKEAVITDEKGRTFTSRMYRDGDGYFCSVPVAPSDYRRKYKVSFMGVQREFSVEQYFDNAKELYSKDPKMNGVIDAARKYCEAAAWFFKTDDKKPVIEWTKKDKDLLKKEGSKYKPSKKGRSIYGYSLLLEDKTKIRMYYEKDGESFITCGFSPLEYNKTVLTEDDIQTPTVMNYVYTVIDGKDADEPICILCKALFKYYEAVKQYSAELR